jgi:hypothetical protein
MAASILRDGRRDGRRIMQTLHPRSWTAAKIGAGGFALRQNKSNPTCPSADGEFIVINQTVSCGKIHALALVAEMKLWSRVKSEMGGGRVRRADRWIAMAIIGSKLRALRAHV